VFKTVTDTTPFVQTLENVGDQRRGGTSKTFFVKAYHSVSTMATTSLSVFVDNVTFIPMLTVIKTSTMGISVIRTARHGQRECYIRARDSNQISGHTSKDTYNRSHVSFAIRNEPDFLADRSSLAFCEGFFFTAGQIPGMSV